MTAIPPYSPGETQHPPERREGNLKTCTSLMPDLNTISNRDLSNHWECCCMLLRFDEFHRINHFQKGINQKVTMSYYLTPVRLTAMKKNRMWDKSGNVN